MKLSSGLHRHLVMALRTPALTKKLQVLDLEDTPGEPHPDALEVLDAVVLTPAQLAKVKTLQSLSMEDVSLVVDSFDGDADPFGPDSLDELALLPNLEELRWASAMPPPPVDPKAL